MVWPQRDLANALRHSDVKFFDYQQKANPAYADSMTSPMDIIADLTSSINEHTAKGSPQDVAVGASNVIVAAVENLRHLSPIGATFLFFSYRFLF